MKILIGGDCCFEGVDKIDKSSLQDIQSLTADADFSIINLESPLTTSNQKLSKSGPCLKGSPQMTSVLKEMGIDLVTLANNHMMDFSIKGLSDTLFHLESSGVDHVGAGINYTEASRTYVRNINGKSLGIVNCCETEWSTTTNFRPGCNPLDLALNYGEVLNSIEMNQHTIVIIHGGIEGFKLPSEEIKNRYRFFAQMGVDAVIAHHTHLVSGMEVYNGTPIFYGIGNMIFSGEHYPGWNNGMIVKLDLEPNRTTNYELIHFDQSINGVIFRRGDESIQQQRNKEINELSKIIANSILLENEVIKFAEKQFGMYDNYLTPRKNVIKRILRRMGFLKPTWSGREQLYLSNIIRCPSHREIILRYLA